MKLYTVKDVAKLSGVTVRALHHYDQVGLLKPAEVGENGYRYYGHEELLRLQQILLHRELELPLEAIAEVLDQPGFDRLAALRRHRKTLSEKAVRYRRLTRTLDRTLAALEGETEMKDEDLYKGFEPSKQAQYEAYLVDRLGDQARARGLHWARPALHGASGLPRPLRGAPGATDRVSGRGDAVVRGAGAGLGGLR